jgi:hypothetical protein
MTVSNFKLSRLLIIVGAIFLLEVPGCVIVFADDAGQISYFEHETLIEFSKKTFAAPLIQVTGSGDSYTSLLLVYVGNLLLLALLVFLLINGIRRLRLNLKGANKKLTHD